MARLLVERETIFTEEVDMLMEGKSVEEIMEFMDNSTEPENPFDRMSVKDIIVEEKKEESLENTDEKTEETKDSNEDSKEDKTEEDNK